jgi:hypothetical protein
MMRMHSMSGLPLSLAGCSSARAGQKLGGPREPPAG